MGLNPLLSVKFAKIKGKLSGISIEEIEKLGKKDKEQKDIKTDFFETKNGYISRIGDVEFRTLTEKDEYMMYPLFLLYSINDIDFLKNAIEKDPRILDYLNKELERFGYYPVKDLVEFQALFTPEEVENLKKKVDQIHEKELIPFFGFPLTHDYVVHLIIRHLGELYGIKPKIRTLPLKEKEVQVDKEILTGFTLKDVRPCLNFFKERNIVACLLKILSKKKGGENLMQVLEENRSILEFPLSITEVLYG